MFFRKGHQGDKAGLLTNIANHVKMGSSRDGGRYMPLIKCPDCGKDVSSFADTCPNCGYQFAKIREQQQAQVQRQERERRRVEHMKHAPVPNCEQCIHWGDWEEYIENPDNPKLFEHKTGCNLHKEQYTFFLYKRAEKCSSYKWADEDNY